MAKIDIDELSVEQIQNMLKEKKKREADKLSEQGEKIRGELDAYCQKTYGMSLAAIFTAGKRSQYANPANKSEVYNGRGKPPKWFADLSDEDRKKCKIAA